MLTKIHTQVQKSPERPKHWTNIEIRLAAALSLLEIPYIPQKKILTYRVDFYLPRRRLCLEADGAYWHEAQRDARRDQKLKDAGYTVLRLTEKEILGNRLLPILVNLLLRRGRGRLRQAEGTGERPPAGIGRRPNQRGAARNPGSVGKGVG